MTSISRRSPIPCPLKSKERASRPTRVAGSCRVLWQPQRIENAGGQITGVNWLLRKSVTAGDGLPVRREHEDRCDVFLDVLAGAFPQVGDKRFLLASKRRPNAATCASDGIGWLLSTRICASRRTNCGRSDRGEDDEVSAIVRLRNP